MRPIVLPALPDGQRQAWQDLLLIGQSAPENWTLVGGQMIQLWCAERGVRPHRATTDIDAVVDIRARPEALALFTGQLQTIGYTPLISADGVQHRWTKGGAQFDVLIPEGVGQRAGLRQGAGGARTVEAQGASQALTRSERVEVLVADSRGHVARPSLLGALVMKAAANAQEPHGRHRSDFLTLASLLRRGDIDPADITPKDRKRLQRVIVAVENDERLRFENDTTGLIQRVQLACGLS